MTTHRRFEAKSAQMQTFQPRNSYEIQTRRLSRFQSFRRLHQGIPSHYERCARRPVHLTRSACRREPHAEAIWLRDKRFGKDYSTHDPALWAGHQKAVFST